MHTFMVQIRYSFFFKLLKKKKCIGIRMLQGCCKGLHAVFGIRREAKVFRRIRNSREAKDSDLLDEAP